MLLLAVLLSFAVGNVLANGNVDRQANPCDDFFKFACGKVLQNKDERIATVGSQMKEVEDTIVSLLESSSLYAKATPIRSTKRFYERCLDMDPTEDDLKNEVSQFVADYADWPLFHPNSSNFNVWEVAAKLQGELSIDSFFGFSIGTSPKCDSKSFEPIISPSGGVFLDNKQPFEPCERAILGMLQKFQKVISGKRIPSNDSLEELCMFEMEMSNYFAGHTEPDQELYLDELDTVKHSEPIWKSYFNTVAQHDTSKKLAGWLEDKTVRVKKPSFLEFLVEKVETTPVATLGNFLMFKLIKFASSFLMTPTSVGKEDEEVMEISLRCTDFSPAGYQKCECLSKTMNLFPKVAGHLFINPSNQTQLENKFAINIVDQIRSSAKSMFEKNEWLSEMAKVRILKKLDNMISTVGYNESVLHMDDLTELYKHMSVKNNDNFFDIYRRFSSFNAAGLETNFSRYKLAMAEVTVNAVYDQDRNSIFLPIAILKTLGLSSDYPDWFNLASPGSVIGHEIFHAFDNEGSLYDHIGSQMSTDERNPYLMVNSIDRYNKLTNCFRDDYSQHQYTYLNSNLTLNGSRTLGENLADFNGVQATYKAFQSIKGLRDPVVLGDFQNFTEEKMFFISYATSWCSNDLIFEDVMRYAVDDEHSPNDARVNGVLRNLPEFRETFGCQPGDVMYQNYLGEQCKFY